MAPTYRFNASKTAPSVPKYDEDVINFIRICERRDKSKIMEALESSPDPRRLFQITRFDYHPREYPKVDFGTVLTYFSAHYRAEHVIEALIRYKRFIDADRQYNHHGDNPLIIAIAKCDHEQVQLFAKHFPSWLNPPSRPLAYLSTSISSSILTPLLYHVSTIGARYEKTRLEIVETLVAAGVDLDAVDEEGRTALVIATLRGLQATAVFLFERCSKPNRINDEEQLLFAAAEGNCPSIVAGLFAIQSSAFDAQNEEGNSSMHVAAQRHNFAVLIELIDAGADPLLRNKRGMMAIQEVAMVDPATMDGEDLEAHHRSLKTLFGPSLKSPLYPGLFSIMRVLWDTDEQELFVDGFKRYWMHATSNPTHADFIVRLVEAFDRFLPLPEIYHVCFPLFATTDKRFAFVENDRDTVSTMLSCAIGNSARNELVLELLLRLSRVTSLVFIHASVERGLLLIGRAEKPDTSAIYYRNLFRLLEVVTCSKEIRLSVSKLLRGDLDLRSRFVRCLLAFSAIVEPGGGTGRCAWPLNELCRQRIRQWVRQNSTGDAMFLRKIQMMPLDDKSHSFLRYLDEDLYEMLTNREE